MPPQSPKFSGWLDDIIKISSSVAPIILGATQGGGASSGGIAKGLAGINAFGERVMQALTQLEAQVSNMPSNQKAQMREQVTQAVSQLVASLSDGAQVYQAKKGKDAEALARFKADANSKAQSILALLNTDSGGGIITGNGSSDGGLLGRNTSGQDNTLLYLGLGAIAIIFITRN